MHIAEAISCIMQGGLIMRGWSPKVSRVHNALSKVVSQCRGGLFLPGLEGGAWWSSQEGRGRGTKELETQSLNSTPLTLHRTWMMMDEVWRHRKETYLKIVNTLLSSPGQSKLLENVHQVSRYVSASPAAAVTGIRPPPPPSPISDHLSATDSTFQLRPGRIFRHWGSCLCLLWFFTFFRSLTQFP